MLLALSAFLGILVVWLLIVRPVDHLLALARERHAAAVLNQSATHEQWAMIRQLERGPTVRANVPASLLIGQLATESGIPLERNEAESPTRASIAIDAIKPNSLFDWLADLERRRGLIVDALNTKSNSDSTISAEVRLRLKSL